MARRWQSPSIFFTALVLFASSLCLSNQEGQAAGRFQHVQTLMARDAEPGDLFGKLVDLDGEIAIVRSRTQNSLKSHSKRPSPQTHVFGFQGNRLVESGIIDLGTVINEHAIGGQEVDLEDGDLIFGMVGSNTAFYNIRFGTITDAFQPDTWKIEGIPARDPDIRNAVKEHVDYGYKVGHSVAIRGDTALMSDLHATFTDRRLSRGAIHTYQRDDTGTWHWNGLIAPNDMRDGESFGRSLAYDGKHAAVTSVTFGRRGTVERNNTGIHFFEHTGQSSWSRTDFFDMALEDTPAWWNSSAPWEEYRGSYPYTVDLEDNIALARVGKTSQGAAVLVMTKTQERADRNDFAWEVVQVIPEALLADGRGFDIDGDRFAVAALGEDGKPLVEVYELDRDLTLTRIDTVKVPDPIYSDTFGYSISFDRGKLLVGAPSYLYQEEPGDPPSAAFLFALVPEPSSAILLTIAAFAGSSRSRFPNRRA